MSIVYCTIVARNYLSQALTLHRSIRRHEPETPLVILVVDEGAVTVPETPFLHVVRTDFLGLDPDTIVELATIYDVVEFSTCLKPLLLSRLLEQYDNVVYLDPDTYLLSALTELPGLLDVGAKVLTPHFLEPIAPGSTQVSEVHSLTVGLYNLGFCAVSREAKEFLDWWWMHLRYECLIYPLLGLFVDQKWADVGSVLFPTTALRHYGYNVGPWNIHERPIAGDALAGFRVGEGDTADPLRLFHFSGFDPMNPSELSTRLGESTSGLRGSGAVDQLCAIYAADLIAVRAEFGRVMQYGYECDTRGRRLSHRVRRAYRAQRLVNPQTRLPSPFAVGEAEDFDKWCRSARGSRLQQGVMDAFIAAKYAFPDEFKFLKTRLGFSGRLRRRLLDGGLVRR